MKETILITGGTGYIGSHTVVELAAAGYGAVVVDDLSNSEASVADRLAEITGRPVPFERVDCTDREKLEEVFRRHAFGAVIHFAASKAVGESVEKPLLYYRNNLVSLLNVLDLMQAYGVRDLVFSSSCTVYGQPDRLPVTEETPRRPPTSPYGNTKQVAEDIIADTVRASGGKLRAVNLRYFNPIGAHPSALIGELPRGVPGNLVPYITQTAAGIRECLSIFGSDYPTPDGTAVRDYIDVTDLARAHVSALERLGTGRGKSGNEYFNVGTGRGVSVLELVRTFEEVNGLKLNYRLAERRAGDIERIWADPSLARRELGWTARVPLAETLKNAWQWEKKVRGLE